MLSFERPIQRSRELREPSKESFKSSLESLKRKKKVLNLL
jgi:hypothetical protein